MLKAELDKKQNLLHLINDDVTIHTEIVDVDDVWFSATVGRETFNFNYANKQLGMFENVKMAKNTYETGDFINAIDITVV